MKAPWGLLLFEDRVTGESVVMFWWLAILMVGGAAGGFSPGRVPPGRFEYSGPNRWEVAPLLPGGWSPWRPGRPVRRTPCVGGSPSRGCS